MELDDFQYYLTELCSNMGKCKEKLWATATLPDSEEILSLGHKIPYIVIYLFFLHLTLIEFLLGACFCSRC